MDITRCREIVLLAVALAAVTAGPPHAAASRIALAPSSVAAECPVIVTGEIVKIDQFAAKAPDRFGGKTIRLLDVAHIRISQVNKNLLTGVSTKVGQTITARMHPPKGRRIAGVPVMTYCLDLHYKLGTKALWMLYLQEDGHFYINRRPEQRQPVGSYDKIKGRTVDVLHGKPPKPGELASQIHTVKEWLAARRKARLAQVEAQRRHKAFLADVKKAVVDLYADGKLQVARLPSLIDQRAKVRSKLANWPPRQMGISQDDWVVVRCYLAQRDPVLNHRVRGVSALGAEWAYGRGKPLLLAALKDQSASMRLFACQTLMFTKDKSVAGEVAKLLGDKDPGVRRTAVRTLGWLGGEKHVQPILELYKSDKPRVDDCWVYADALARLGEQTVSLQAAVKAMKSTNWNVRHFAVLAISFNKSPAVVRAVLSLLPGELARTVAEMKSHRVGDRVLVGLCRELAKRTDQQCGSDIAAWMTWWSAMAPKYGAEAPTQTQIAETKRIQTEYYRLLGRKVTPK